MRWKGFQSDKSDRESACVWVCFSRAEIFRLTQPSLHYLTTVQTTATMIVAVCCRIVVLYSQENRCLLLPAVTVQRKECGQPEISHKITAHFQGSDFSSGPIVPETICGVLEKESVVTKYAEYFWKNSLHDYDYNLLIWSQSVTHKKGHSPDCQLWL